MRKEELVRLFWRSPPSVLSSKSIGTTTSSFFSSSLPARISKAKFKTRLLLSLSRLSRAVIRMDLLWARRRRESWFASDSSIMIVMMDMLCRLLVCFDSLELYLASLKTGVLFSTFSSPLCLARCWCALCSITKPRGSFSAYLWSPLWWFLVSRLDSYPPVSLSLSLSFSSERSSHWDEHGEGNLKGWNLIIYRKLLHSGPILAPRTKTE